MKRVPLVDRSRPASLAPRVPRSYRVADGIQTDSMENLITGLGTASDKMTGTTFVFNEMNKQQLEFAFRSDWIARKCVTIPAADATRQWRSWKSDQKDIEAIEELEKKLQVQQKVRQAMTKARLYGGAALLMGVNQGARMDTPLDVEKVGKDALEFLHVVTKWELSAGELEYDIASENYGQPKYFTRAGGSGETIDPSRVIKFVGNDVPDLSLTMGWGDSVMQVLQDAVMSAGLTCAAGAQLVQETKMDVVHIPELTESLSNKEYESRLTKRFGLANQTKSLYNIMLLDGEEKWERIVANLTGLPDVLKMYLLIASGAADIPATRFLGQSPVGLSATGESDIRNYYDHVKAEQETVQGVAMRPLDEIIIRSALGTVDPASIVYEWNPLWQLSDSEKGTLTTQKATAFKTDVDAGLIPSEVLRDARINQLVEDGTYPGLEQILDDYGPLEPIDDNPEPGSVIGPDGQPIAPTDPKHPDNQPQLGPDGKPIPAKLGPDGKPLPPAKKPKPIGDMARRVRLANPKDRKYRHMDGVMRTLYVRRNVLNAGEIMKWAKAQGIPGLMSANELHVTVCYSRTPLDWALTGSAYGEDENGQYTIKPGGMRVVQKFGNAIVLCFGSTELQWRHGDLQRSAGATYEFAEYQPHVTVAYIGTDDEPFDVEGIAAYQGKIVLGPEVYAEANGNPMIADANGNPFFSDMNENHDPSNGQFTEGSSSTSVLGHTDKQVADWKNQLNAFEPNNDHAESSVGFMQEAISRYENTKLSDKATSRLAVVSHTGKIAAAGYATWDKATKEGKIVAIGSIQRGAGAVALKKLEGEMKAKGVRSVSLEANEQNQSFYAKAGYTKTKGGDNEEAIVMKKRLTDAISDFNENHDPANGEFSSGAGGTKEANVKAGAKAAIKNLMSKEGAKAAIKAGVGKVNANKMALINGAVQTAMYHGAGIDYGPDIEKAIGHEIEHLAQNAKVAIGQAKGWMSGAGKSLLAFARATGHRGDAAHTDFTDAGNPAVVALKNMLKAVEAYEEAD